MTRVKFEGWDAVRIRNMLKDYTFEAFNNGITVTKIEGLSFDAAQHIAQSTSAVSYICHIYCDDIHGVYVRRYVRGILDSQWLGEKE